SARPRLRFSQFLVSIFQFPISSFQFLVSNFSFSVSKRGFSMAVKVMMPKGSDTMTEGKVLKWFKKEGDAISTGDTVVEIETDKVNMEVEAMGSGVLRKILVAVNKVVPVGELLAVIGKTDEDISALVKPNGAGALAPAAAAHATSNPAPLSTSTAPAVGG